MTQPDRTVFIVDDDRGILSSLKWLLESTSYQVETFSSADEFLERTCEPMPVSCLIVDVRMPDTSGLELLQILRSRGITIPAIVISGHADVPMAVNAMKTGALDFLEKPFDEQDLLDRIEKALSIDHVHRTQRDAREKLLQRMRRLTRREREVMDLVVQGKSNKDIANDLNISNKTVEAHRAKVMKKMEADSLARLVKSVLQLAS
ncbi:MAG: response regulator transcription factor [Gemmatimonadetes bacterium]|nr:response regulator transcription factor [Gemmatimonadota bacterium]